MTETLYRKSWQPLAEADKSTRQVVRDRHFPQVIFTAFFTDGLWVFGGGKPVHGHRASEAYHSYEFLCLEPVEVETDDFPKVI